MPGEFATVYMCVYLLIHASRTLIRRGGGRDSLQEQMRALKAEDRARRQAIEHENRVSKLEQKLAQLSEVANNYNKYRQEDQETITKLKVVWIYSHVSLARCRLAILDYCVGVVAESTGAVGVGKHEYKMRRRSVTNDGRNVGATIAAHKTAVNMELHVSQSTEFSERWDILILKNKFIFEEFINNS